MKAQIVVRWIILITVLAVFAAVTGYLLRSSDHPLLDVSTELLSMKQFDAEQKYRYQWQTDQSLLLFRSNLKAGNALPERIWDVLRWNMKSGLFDHLTPLEKRFNESYVYGQFGPYPLISPNEQWVVWTARNQYIAATLDGKSSVRLPNEALDEIHFTSDSLHLIDLVEEEAPEKPNTFPYYCITHVNLLHLENPASHDVRQLASPSPLRLTRSNPLDVGGIPWVKYSEKAISADNFLYCYGEFEDSRFPVSNPGETVVNIYHLDLTKQGAITGQTAIKFPQGSWMSEMPFSNDGKRIAFWVREENASALQELIQRFYPAYQVQKRERTYLIVCRIDGSERHTIGYQEQEGDPESVYDLRWLPGDRALSFLYRDALWKVPTD